jgi:hypothetical protein
MYLFFRGISILPGLVRRYLCQLLDIDSYLVYLELGCENADHYGIALLRSLESCSYH